MSDRIASRLLAAVALAVILVACGGAGYPQPSSSAAIAEANRERPLSNAAVRRIEQASSSRWSWTKARAK